MRRIRMSTVHTIEVYVRFSETDAAGHVNNTSHFLYLDEARSKFFKQLGIGEAPEDATFNLILASTTCDYLAQAYAAEILNVTTTVSKIGTKSFTLYQEITNKETGITIAKSTATLVCFNYVEQKTVPIPPELRERLQQMSVKSV